MSEFEGHGRGFVDNRPQMPEHADDSPPGSEKLAQAVETERHASPGKERDTPRGGTAITCRDAKLGDYVRK